MSERVCEGCRFYHRSTVMAIGSCRRNPPVGDGSELPEVGLKDWCGEWRDKNVTAEQEERRELVRRIFTEMVAKEWTRYYKPDGLWKLAGDYANAEPDYSEIPNS
jgi:hypothetical protein